MVSPAASWPRTALTVTPGVADARQAAHPVRIDGNPLVRHALRVRPPAPSRPAHRACLGHRHLPDDRRALTATDDLADSL